MTRVGSAASRTFVSLKVRNYRYYFIGQFVSMTGASKTFSNVTGSERRTNR